MATPRKSIIIVLGQYVAGTVKATSRLEAQTKTGPWICPSLSKGAIGLFRRTRVLHSPGSGAFRFTSVRKLWWGYKDTDLHRLARPRPWWENAAIFVGLVLFIQLSSFLYYFLNRVYHAYKPSGNDLLVVNRIDTLVFTRPDLAVAAVRMALHQILCGEQTPFGDPIVAPEYMRPEAEALCEFVVNLHNEQPNFSIPDLWALMTAKALARLGGPIVQARRGRPDPISADGTPKKSVSQMLVFRDTLVPEDRRDVLNLKRVLSKQGYSLQEIIAVLGGIRNIGYHEVSGVHTTEEIKPMLRRLARDMKAPSEETVKSPESQLKCTMDPYVFGGEYFNYLLDYHWKRSLFSRRGPFYCREDDRRREVTLLDPFSEEAVDREKRKLRARERAHEAMERATAKREADLLGNNEETAVNSDESVPTPSKGGLRNLFGRTGEAQTIPGVKVDKYGNLINEDVDIDEDYEQLYELEKKSCESPCETVSMREIDVMLLDDALCVGWLHRFCANEIQFYTTFGEVLSKVQNLGYNVNSLYLP